jgi:hypothetical protein
MQGKEIISLHSFVNFSIVAELGDYTKDEHSVENISEFRFLPDERQTEEFEEQVLAKWATYKYLNN